MIISNHHPTLEKIWAFLRLTRPLFLAGGVIMVAVGLSIASWQGYSINLQKALLAQGLVTIVQLMAQYANEFFDIEGDRLNLPNRTWFSGGSGILPTGEISPQWVLKCMRSLLIASCVLLIIITVWSFSSALLLVGAFSILGSWYYSAPPIALKGSGWGEFSASVIVTIFVPLTAYLFQTSRINLPMLWFCVPLLAVHMAMLIAFSLPDRSSDGFVGKRTLAVRLGLRKASVLHHGLIITAFLMAGSISILFHLSGVTWLWIIPFTLAVGQIVAVENYIRHPSKQPALMTLGAVALFTISSLFWMAKFL
jgi:1,4-dihydroxy-2-naphthoate polyprenyltransferase